MNDADHMSESLASEILTYYETVASEHDRLSQGLGPLEELRTRELIIRHLPLPPSTVLDVGGGPGVYAQWLAVQGYTVQLFDPVPLHVAQAREALAGFPSASAELGDARSLDVADASVDAVLLLGPLYHLTEQADRLRAVREAVRVLRPGGLLFAVGISRFTSLFDGLTAGFLADPVFADMVNQDLRDGHHRNPSHHPDYFTTAYFHYPDELQQEMREAGLSIVELVSIEGPGSWLTRDFDLWWNDADRREQLLAAVRAVEREPSLIGLGPHLMVIARRG